MSLDREVTSLEDLQGATLISTHDLAVLTAVFTDASGNEVMTRRTSTLFSDRINGTIRSFPLVRMNLTASALARKLTRGETYTVTITALDAAGARMPVCTLTFTL